MSNISVKLFLIWTSVKEMLFKDISVFSSDGHFVQCSITVCAILVEGTTLNISVHYIEHFCEIILNLDLWLCRCCSKIFLFLPLATNSFSRAEPFVLFKYRAIYRIFM